MMPTFLVILPLEVTRPLIIRGRKKPVICESKNSFEKLSNHFLCRCGKLLEPNWKKNEKNSQTDWKILSQYPMTILWKIQNKILSEILI